MNLQKRVFVTPHDPSWCSRFSKAAKSLLPAFGRNAIAIHHIGSTAIPGIVAKPVIDVLVEVASVDQVDAEEREICKLGYEAMGEYGIPGRRYFRRPANGECPAFHVHVFPTKSEYAMRHIAFRDFLLAHPEKAKAYSELKERFAVQNSASKSDYQAAKAPFVETWVQEAMDWAGNGW